jgi:hypothetical protein
VHIRGPRIKSTEHKAIRGTANAVTGVLVSDSTRKKERAGKKRRIAIRKKFKAEELKKDAERKKKARKNSRKKARKREKDKVKAAAGVGRGTENERKVSSIDAASDSEQ